MAKKNKKANADNDDMESFLYSVTSSTDCTGLMPKPAITGDEEDSYTNIYHIPRPSDKSNSK